MRYKLYLAYIYYIRYSTVYGTILPVTVADLSLVLAGGVSGDNSSICEREMEPHEYMEWGDDADSASAHAAVDDGDELGGTKVPFAFFKCKNVKHRSSSVWEGVCSICGKSVATTPHKMMYGHYLQKRGEHIGNFCVSVAKLRKDNPDFFASLKEKWSSLNSKRTFRFKDHAIAQKRMRALDDDAESVEPADCWQVDTSDRRATCSEGSFSGVGSASLISKSKLRNEVPYSFLKAEEKQRLREECQKVWDMAFVVCGVSFRTADHLLFREAIAKTRNVPDFKLACSKTMRTTRLVALDSEAQQYKEIRLKAGAEFGFAITSDGWRSVAKRNYHNYILLSVEGPIFLSLVEVTGEGGTGEDVEKSFEAQFRKLQAIEDRNATDVVKHILLGITDTPSANRKAWRLLESSHPKQLGGLWRSRGVSSV